MNAWRRWSPNGPDANFWQYRPSRFYQVPGSRPTNSEIAADVQCQLFLGLILRGQKSIHAVDRSPASQQSHQQSHRQRGDHFPEVEVRAVHAKAQ
jgi:hypothetical protein